MFKGRLFSIGQSLLFQSHTWFAGRRFLCQSGGAMQLTEGTESVARLNRLAELTFIELHEGASTPATLERFLVAGPDMRMASRFIKLLPVKFKGPSGPFSFSHTPFDYLFGPTETVTIKVWIAPRSWVVDPRTENVAVSLNKRFMHARNTSSSRCGESGLLLMTYSAIARPVSSGPCQPFAR